MGTPTGPRYNFIKPAGGLRYPDQPYMDDVMRSDKGLVAAKPRQFHVVVMNVKYMDSVHLSHVLREVFALEAGEADLVAGLAKTSDELYAGNANTHEVGETLIRAARALLQKTYQGEWTLRAAP